MPTFPTPLNVATQATKQDSWLAYLGGTVTVQLMAALLCPEWQLGRRSLFFLGAILFFLMVPFVWSLYLLFAYRSRRERLVSYVSLLAATPWLFMAERLLFELFEAIRA
jgi:hypothetical protein